ncbi:MAG: SRPBCC family protein [Candidatus Kariarchaeaceae archaeon]|jgi:uncharacterized protein YndB with AHSA1/START domain
MSTYDWSKFERKIYIKAPLQQVFDHWVQPDPITTWFIKHATYITPEGTKRKNFESVQTGDKYKWEWHQDLTANGEVLEVIPHKLFRFTFGDKEKGSSEKVEVNIEFGAEGDESYFTLTQHNMGGPDLDRAQYHLSCNMGWSFFMTNMKALLEHGVDLRETDPDRAYETRAVSL